VTFLTSVIGIAAGRVQGYFGGSGPDLPADHRDLEFSTPSLYIIIIISAIFTMNFWLLVFLMVLFGWTGLVGVVRAEFLRARNFEYVRAARALGVGNWTIMFRHVLPNAMVATLTFLPFIVTGTIGALASLDFLGFGLPSSAPSLGEMTLQAKNNLRRRGWASPPSSPSRSCCRCWSSSSRACATPSTRARRSHEGDDAGESERRLKDRRRGATSETAGRRNLTVRFGGARP
jgi:ABC-type dipeptide/oligopeptide/nickel transport system permease subunit